MLWETDRISFRMEAMPYSPNLPISPEILQAFSESLLLRQVMDKLQGSCDVHFLKTTKKKDLWFLKFQEKCFLGENVIHEAWYTYKNVLEMFVLPNFILSWQHIEAWGSQLTDGIIRLGRELGPHKVTERVHSSTWTAKSQARVLCVAQRVRHLPAMQETQVQSMGKEDPLEEEMTTHSSIPDWRTPWTEEPGGLQSMGSQRVRHDWITNTHTQYLKTVLSLTLFKYFA